MHKTAHEWNYAHIHISPVIKRLIYLVSFLEENRVIIVLNHMLIDSFYINYYFT